MNSDSSTTSSMDEHVASTSQGKRKARKGRGAKLRQRDKQMEKFNERTYRSVKEDLATAAIRLIGISDSSEMITMQRQFDEWDKLLAEGKPIIFSAGCEGRVIASDEPIEVGLDMAKVDKKPEVCTLDDRCEIVESPSLDDVEIDSDIRPSSPIDDAPEPVSFDAVLKNVSVTLPVDHISETLPSQFLPFDAEVASPDNAPVYLDDAHMEVTSPEVNAASVYPAIYKISNGKGFSSCITIAASSPAKRTKIAKRRFSITTVSVIGESRYSVTFNSTCRHLYATYPGSGVHIVRHMEDKYLYRIRPGEIILWFEDG